MTNKNIVCPLSCGVCCDEHWRDVFFSAPESQRQCLFQGKTGCKLPRSKRAYACTAYLCTLAQCVIAGAVTMKAAQRYLEQAEHDSAALDEMLWKHKQKKRRGVEAMKEQPATKEKVIRCPWRSVVFHAKRRAPKGYRFGHARNLDANKVFGKKGDRVKVRAWVTYVRGEEPCDRCAP